MRGEKRQMSLAGLLAIILLAAGCTHTPASVSSVDQNNGQRQTEMALRDAKTEAAVLRSDLALTRIAAAKQEAELRELRRQVNELQQILDAKHAELITLREERDRLAHTTTIAQVRVADPSVLPAHAADVASLLTKLQAMESALAVLTAELAQVKKEMAQPALEPKR